VSDDALVTCIQELRKALGDDSKQPRYIETRHRLGYRFAAPIDATAPPAETGAAIAVLPFADMSPGRDQDYLCEGLAEELIDALTHVEGLRVAARTSSFQFRGDHDLREVGRKLGVGSLLEGSVRKAGDRLRVTVQLIDVATGYHQWSEKFERDAGDVFAMQDEIAEKVATLLRGGELSNRERRAVRRQPTAIDTYECFLRGRQRMHTMQQPQMDEAHALFQRAIELDAEYAPAWAGLATLHALSMSGGDRPRRPRRSRPRQPHSHGSRAGSRRRTSRARLHAVQPAALRRRAQAFRSGRAHQPESLRRVLLLWPRGVCRRRHREIIELWHKAGACAARISRARCCRRSRCASWAGSRIARGSTGSRAARREARRAQSIQRPRLSFGAARCRKMASSSARSSGRRRAEALYPDDMGVIINGACNRAKSGLKTEALDLLELMFNKGWGKKDWVENDPDYDSLRAEPRFIAMMAKLK
jgi:adenylate cyclase